MKVYVVMVEYDEEHQVPIAVFDNEPAAQHKAKYTLGGEVIPLEIQSIDNTPELMRITYDNSYFYSHEDYMELTPLCYGETHTNTTIVERVWCQCWHDGKIRLGISIIVEEKLLFDGWEDKARHDFDKLLNYAQELHNNGKSDQEIKEIITKQLNEVITK